MKRPKLPPEQVRWAREKYAAGGVTIQAIADELGASHGVAHQLLNGRTYQGPTYGIPVKTCPARGDLNPKTKLTSDQAYQIMQDYTPRWGSIHELAGRFQVDPAAVLQVLRRCSFKYVEPPANFQYVPAKIGGASLALEQTALEILEVADRLGSVAAAARELGIKPRVAQSRVQRFKKLTGDPC